jgi:hypothetical protein
MNEGISSHEQIDITPVGGGRFSLQEPGFGQDKRTRANAGDMGAGSVLPDQPVNDRFAPFDDSFFKSPAMAEIMIKSVFFTSWIAQWGSM